MSGDQSTREHAAPPAGGRTFDADLNFLSRWAAPLGLLARAMLAYIFIVEGAAKITSYAGVVDYMQANGVDGRLLPLVILTELGGGLLGARRLEDTLGGDRAVRLLPADGAHSSTSARIRRSNSARTSRWPAASSRSRSSAPAAGRWTPGAGEPSRDAGKRPSVRPRLLTASRRFALRRPAAAAYREPFGVAYPRPRHVLKAPNVERRRQADQ